MKTNLIEYIVANTKYKQKDIAEALGVSTAQVSKWKAGETIPQSRIDELKALTDCFDRDPEWAELVKNREKGKAWCEYFQFMVDQNSYETGCMRVVYEIDSHVKQFLLFVLEIGGTIPDTAPVVSLQDLEEENLTEFDELVLEWAENFIAYAEWCSWYLAELPDEFSQYYDQLHYAAIKLAFSPINDDRLLQYGIDLDLLGEQLGKVHFEVSQTITVMCRAMVIRQMSFETDYFDFLNESPYDLYEVLELKAMGDLSVEQFLPCGERKILEELRENKLMLSSIYSMLDKLTQGDAADHEKIDNIKGRMAECAMPCSGEIKEDDDKPIPF